MTYRRDSKPERDWSGWVARHGALLRSYGLPDAVFETEARWSDFLEHGVLDHHDDPTGFSVDDVKAEHVRQLVLFLEEQLASQSISCAIALDLLRDRAGGV